MGGIYAPLDHPQQVRPYPDKGLFLPVHGFLLNVNGVNLIENLDLEALARDKAHEFAFIVEPLKLRGATGSSVAPIAVRRRASVIARRRRRRSNLRHARMDK
jgi:kynurenine formamidase